MAEPAEPFQSLRRCLELRDKYIRASRQRLNDDPRHYDGSFSGLDDANTGVCGVRPDGNFHANEPPASQPKWTLSPPWTDCDDSCSDRGDAKDPQIPGAHPFTFKIDDQGVIQIYTVDTDSKPDHSRPVYDIPSVREYFVDLDYVLGVISDGPAKSFAFQRLKYLSSKFTMYSLLNEFQELSDMKVLVAPVPALSLLIPCPASPSSVFLSVLVGHV